MAQSVTQKDIPAMASVAAMSGVLKDDEMLWNYALGQVKRNAFVFIAKHFSWEARSLDKTLFAVSIHI